MPETLPAAGWCLDWIIASPHRDSFHAFINAANLEQSGLHALLHDLFPWDLPRKDGDPLRVEYLGYRVATPVGHEQPGPAFFEHRRTYQRLLKITLQVCVDGQKRPPQEYLFARLPWLTEQDTFLIKGQEIIPLAQLLPMPGMLCTRKLRLGRAVAEEFVVDIHPIYGCHLRLHCRQRAAKSPGPPRLLASVQAGSFGRWELYQFLTGILTPEELQPLHAVLERYFPKRAKPKNARRSSEHLDEEPQDAAAEEQAERTRWRDLRGMLFDHRGRRGFDLGDAGRMRLSTKLTPAWQYLHLPPATDRALTPADVCAMVVYLVALATGEPFTATLDDVEHLANQQVRLVGDFLGEALRRGVLRARERLRKSASDTDTQIGLLATLVDDVDDQVQSCLRLGPLFQILDTTNPLAAVSHKRTVTRGGPGGVSSEYPNLEKRDVHPSHYGRLCPCETPESEDIGLTLHLALYARVRNGQIETPVVPTATPSEMTWLRPAEIADQALCTEAELQPDRTREQRVLTRRYQFSGNPAHLSHSEAAYVSKITYRDVVLEQQLGVAAGLIPFLTHSDANRMLMGAKNLKQALPLRQPEVPLVQTGMEEVVAHLGRGCVAPAHAGGTALVDGKLALGVNVLVAYMPWRGYNFADAIVASDRLVRLLTSVHATEIAFDLLAYERIVNHDANLPAHLDTSGVVKPGTEVKAGTVLLRTARLVATRHDLTAREIEAYREAGRVYVQDASVYEIEPYHYVAQPGQEGRVTRTDLIRNVLGRVYRVRIWLERVCPLTVGDKLMGRHGNKGVVGAIVPAEQMPTLPNGTPVDLVLNPHGVISRMNLGQLYETSLGWVLKHRERLSPAEQQQLPAVLPPFHTIPRETLRRWLAQTGTDDGVDETGKVLLRDGKGGKPFENPVVVGYQYIVKLDHQPEDKLAARRTGPYTALTQQPVKGRRQHGGQRVGEMETWALQAHQAVHLLDEFFTLKADTPVRRQQFQRFLDDAHAQDGTLDGVLTEDKALATPARLPESLRAALLLLQGIGIVAEPGGTPEAGKESGPRALDALLSQGLSWRYLEEKDVRTWNQQTQQGLRCPGRGPQQAHAQTALRVNAENGFAQALSAEVRVPSTFQRARYVELQCGCQGPEELVIQQDSGTKARVCRAHAAPLQVRRRTERWQPVPGGLYDPLIFGASPYLPAEPTDQEPPEEAPRAWYEHFGYIRLACPIDNPLTHQSMQFLPVLPAIFRYHYAPDAPGRDRLDRPGWRSLDGHYARIIMHNNALRQLTSDSDKYKERKKRLTAAITHLFRGVPERDDIECLARLIKGKRGIFRRAVLGKQTDYSGRAVIVPDPTLALDECRLPYRMGVELLRPWLARALRAAWPHLPASLTAGDQGRRAPQRASGATGHERCIADILADPERPLHRQAIEHVLPEVLEVAGHRRMCLLNRAPSLHKFNVLAFAITLWDQAVIGIPPLVCAGFNADFDGDTMAVHLPLTAAGQQEARERLSPRANLFSPANGQLVLSLTEDIIAGLAYSMPEQARELQGRFGTSMRQDVARARDIADAALRRMQEGFEKATQAGLSFGLFDIPLVEERQEILQQLLAASSRSLGDFYHGTLSAQEREAVADAWRHQVTETMRQRLTEALASPSLNTIALLSLTGARGSVSTVTQLGGMRGLMRRGSGDVIEYPIEAHFVEGLSPLEFFFSTYGSRASLVDKKIQIAPAGDFTRRLVYCAYNLRITEPDCGVAASERSILACHTSRGLCQQCYGEALDTGALPPIGLPVGLLAATAIGERGTQLSLRTFHTGGVKGDNITQGLPHISALLENRVVEIPRERWEKYCPAAQVPDGATHVRCRLGTAAPGEALAIIVGEAYRNYTPEDLPPHLFAVILRAMIDPKEGRIRGLTQAARANLRPLERVAFRNAIQMAADNAKTQDHVEATDHAETRTPATICGLLERLMAARLD